MKSSTPAATAVSQETINQVKERLRVAGLEDDGELGSTGINTHIERLQQSEVSAETLPDYADNLIYL